jgi:hypothetical protein
VIRAFELILDQHQRTVARIAANDIGPKRADALFLRLDCEFQAKRVRQQGDVIDLHKPPRELPGFVLPDLTQVNLFEATECG